MKANLHINETCTPMSIDIPVPSVLQTCRIDIYSLITHINWTASNRNICVSVQSTNADPQDALQDLSKAMQNAQQRAMVIL